MEAVIVATARTPIGRAGKGSLVDCRPDDLSAAILQALLAKVPNAKFHREATPGETLTYTADLVDLRPEGALVRGRVTCGAGITGTSRSGRGGRAGAGTQPDVTTTNAPRILQRIPFTSAPLSTLVSRELGRRHRNTAI